jgi:site-specific DNA-methyltransferase (adenine-specific)
MADRRKPGEVRDAIVAFLSKPARREASVDEIHRAVAARLSGDVARSSVRSYLNLNTPGTFVRTGRGSYRLG